MSPKKEKSVVEIKQGAFIIADAHYSALRPELLSLLKDIHSKKLLATQLILMGDIFDALFGNVEYTQKMNAELIKLINEISNFIEVVYLEGNHDFNLQKIFPKCKVFSIQNQPVVGTYENKIIYLAHGDFNGDRSYKIYTSLIRSPFIMYILKSLDSMLNHFILKRLDKYLNKKNDCKEFINFKRFIEKRLSSKMACDYFIEGHFHQNNSFDIKNFRYINLAAFACNQRYFIVKSLQDREILEENIFSQGI